MKKNTKKKPFLDPKTILHGFFYHRGERVNDNQRAKEIESKTKKLSECSKKRISEEEMSMRIRAEFFKGLDLAY